MGDSYTVGEAVAAHECWPAQLARALQQWLGHRRAADHRRTGWTTSELSKALDAAVPAADRHLVTLQIGVNNQYRGESVGYAYRAEISTLLVRAVELAEGCARRVVVVSIPDWG